MSKRGWDVYRAEKLLAVFHYETLRSLSFSCLTVMQQFVTFWQTTTCCQLSEHMKHKTQGKYWLWCFTIVRLKKLNCAFASLILWCQCSPSLSLSVKKKIIILCNRGSLDHYSLNLTRVHYQTMTESASFIDLCQMPCWHAELIYRFCVFLRFRYRMYRKVRQQASLH